MIEGLYFWLEQIVAFCIAFVVVRIMKRMGR